MPFKPALPLPRGLAGYMALAFSLLSIVLTFVIVKVVEHKATEHVEETIGRGLAELALQTSDKLDRGMYERFREVGLLARRAELGDDTRPLATRRAMLTDVLSSYRYYGWLGLAGLDGKVRVSAKGLLEGADVSQRPWFSQAMRGHHVGDVHEALLLAKLLQEEGDEPMRFVDVAFPYRGPDGQVAGVLGAHLSWAWARDVQESIIAPLEASRQVEAMIVSATGVVLLGPAEVQGKRLPNALLAVGDPRRPTWRQQTWPGGTRYLVGISRSKGYGEYPGLGWSVVVRQKVDTALVPITLLRHYALASGIALALLFSVAGAILARWITGPLKRLARSAHDLRAGGTRPIEGGASSYEEVRDLAASLNGLVSDLVRQRVELEQLNTTLERRVDARTNELAEALAQVQANEQRIHTIIDTAQEAFIGVDLDGRIVDWNTQARAMFGWSRGEALGKPVALTVPERFRYSVEKSLARFRESGELGLLGKRVERVVSDRNGNEIPIEMTVGLVANGSRPFFSVFLHDISMRKKVEQMKNEFIATASHELRTPLTSMRVSLSLLAQGTVAVLEPEAQELADIAHRHCERLVRLVNDMLDIQKIEAGGLQLDRRREDLAALVEEAISAMRGFALPRRIVLERECLAGCAGLEAEVDRDRLLQVLTNLLSNAIKFAPEGSRVAVRIGRHRGSHGDGIRLSVVDHGSGIPAHFRDRIFQRFAQAGSAGGSGLGLSICKGIVEEHGGTLSFTSAEGRGTSFHVDLPDGQAAPAGVPDGGPLVDAGR
ncbi:sensor histidine kinase [uncultured Massilia sp.]|uniref:sensor histidine kinase n=1 Tax=uncultured Massilia sp. TaxID=169973 RepID=UPI0025E71D2A|nr:sensor histidine kinase [uncultured Massilia sp.]